MRASAETCKLSFWLDEQHLELDGLYRVEDCDGVLEMCPIAATPLHIAASIPKGTLTLCRHF